MTKNQIEYQKHKETVRANQAAESLRLDELGETTRHNQAVELETNRSNVAREGETMRHDLATEKETSQHNRTTEVETKRHDLATEANDLIKAQAAQTSAYASTLSASAALKQADTAAQRLTLDNQKFVHDKSMDKMQLKETQKVNASNIARNYAQASASREQASAATRNATTNEKLARISQQDADTRAKQAETQLQQMLNTKLYQDAMVAIEQARVAIEQGKLDETEAHNDVMEMLEARDQNISRQNSRRGVISNIISTLLNGAARVLGGK